MPKDNENIPPFFDGPIAPSEPAGFSPHQMIRCEECLRANPPTRVGCMYCGAVLPFSEASAKLRKPTLRQPEKHQPGFNCLLLPVSTILPTQNRLDEAAQLLKLSPDELNRILIANRTLPVARTDSNDEAKLVKERLAELGLRIAILSDEELGSAELQRVRSLTFDSQHLVLRQAGATADFLLSLDDLLLMVVGRFYRTTVEMKEVKSRQAEHEIVETNQFFADEVVIDLYDRTNKDTWRISAYNFDFSCLGSEKTLLATENIARLEKVISSAASSAHVDRAYNSLRAALGPVWPPEQETVSGGWRRERPGKYSVGAATVNSNESQFTRYSRLCFYFTLNPIPHFD